MRLILISGGLFGFLVVTAPMSGWAQDTLSQAVKAATSVQSPSGRPFVLGALPFVPGTAIRMQLAGGASYIEGDLQGSSDDTITVINARTGTVAIATAAIDALDYKLGARERRYHTLRGAGIGSAAGALIGGLVGAAKPVPKSNCGPDALFCDTFDGLETLANVGTGLLVGALGGAVAGGLLGHADAKKWKPYAVPRIDFGPRTSGKPVTGVSLGFSVR